MTANMVCAVGMTPFRVGSSKLPSIDPDVRVKDVAVLGTVIQLFPESTHTYGTWAPSPVRPNTITHSESPAELFPPTVDICGSPVKLTSTVEAVLASREPIEMRLPTCPETGL